MNKVIPFELLLVRSLYAIAQAIENSTNQYLVLEPTLKELRVWEQAWHDKENS